MKSYTWLIIIGVIAALLGVLVIVSGGSGGWKPLLIGLIADVNCGFLLYFYPLV